MSNAFRYAGHGAWSCDILATEGPEKYHYRGDIFDCLDTLGSFDLIIAHPPCTNMAVCGNSTWANTRERLDAEIWSRNLWDACMASAPRVCFENPVSTISRALPVKAKYVQPWQFGHPETKKTGLWLHNLPPLVPEDDVYEYMMTLPLKERHKIWYASPGPNRGKERSRFYTGIANAMVNQWGTL